MGTIWEWKEGKTQHHRRDGCEIVGNGRNKTEARADWADQMVRAHQKADHDPIIIRYGDYLAIIYATPADIWTNIVVMGTAGPETVTRYNFRGLGGSCSAPDMHSAERSIRLNLAWRMYDPAVDLAQLDDAIPPVIENEEDRREFAHMRDWQRLAQTFKQWAESDGQARDPNPAVPRDRVSGLLHAYASSEQYRPVDKRLTPAEWYMRHERGLIR